MPLPNVAPRDVTLPSQYLAQLGIALAIRNKTQRHITLPLPHRTMNNASMPLPDFSRLDDATAKHRTTRPRLRSTSHYLAVSPRHLTLLYLCRTTPHKTPLCLCFTKQCRTRLHHCSDKPSGAQLCRCIVDLAIPYFANATHYRAFAKLCRTRLYPSFAFQNHAVPFRRFAVPDRANAIPCRTVPQQSRAKHPRRRASLYIALALRSRGGRYLALAQSVISS